MLVLLHNFGLIYNTFYLIHISVFFYHLLQTKLYTDHSKYKYQQQAAPSESSQVKETKLPPGGASFVSRKSLQS